MTSASEPAPNREQVVRVFEAKVRAALILAFASRGLTVKVASQMLAERSAASQQEWLQHPDLVANRSFSLATRLRIQRERDIKAALEQEDFSLEHAIESAKRHLLG